MSKKTVLASALVAAAALFSASVPASMVTADYAWTGGNGWRAAGMIRYDDALSLVTAAGPLGSATTGIDYLDLAIFDPTGLMRGSWVEIQNATVAYNTLKFSLDTAADLLAAGSKLDIGNTAVRNAYFGGTVDKAFYIGFNYAVVDSGPGALAFVQRADPEPDPTPVAAPGTAGLLLLGVGLVGAASRRGVRRAR